MKTNKQKEAGFYLETWHPCQRLILVFSTLPSTYSYSVLKKVPKLLGNTWPFSPKLSWFYLKQVPEIFEILLKSTFSHWKKFHFTQNGYYLADSFKNFILYEVRTFIFYCLYLPWNKETNYLHNSNGDSWEIFGTVYKLIQNDRTYKCYLSSFDRTGKLHGIPLH